MPRFSAGLLAALLIGVAPVAGSGPAPAPGNPHSSTERCADVTASEKIPHRNRVLVETPDIDAPELRLANALISARCFDNAQPLLEKYVIDHPDDFREYFVDARVAWVSGNRGNAERRMNALLYKHPEFASAKVLLASMAIEDRDFKKAQKLLDEVESVHPEDLFAYIDRLRIEAILVPESGTATELQEIMTNPRFPPNAREQASYTIQYELTRASTAVRDEGFRAYMATGGIDQDCALANHAQELLEIRNDPKAAAAEIEHYTGPDTCGKALSLRTLLAEAYLLEASALEKKPGRKSAALVTRAKSVLNGNLTVLAQRVAARPFLTPLVPFLVGAVDSLEIDANGRNVLCNSVMALNPAMVKAELDRGANLKSDCHTGMPNETMVRSIIYMVTTKQIEERQAVLRLLLEYGAPVEGLAFCASPVNGDCATNLLPILQEFAARAGKTVT